MYDGGRRFFIRGIVQGVGFRPGALKLARTFSIAGSVRNEGTAVVIDAFGAPAHLKAFETALRDMRRGGARVDRLESEPLAGMPGPAAFCIAPSEGALPGLGIAPDWAICQACVAETLDPQARRFRYPFTACTDCGPRLSVFQRTPYDRLNTTLAPFPLCADCAREYADEADRRFHAQAIACPACGPRTRLVRLDGSQVDRDALDAQDDIEAAGKLLDGGAIVLVKGLGGYQLACDARNEAAVDHLRQVKRREAKPFALMMRDLAMLGRWCEIDEPSRAAVSSAEAPIVLMPRRTSGPPLARGVAPGLSTLGVMLPNTGLHHLLMQARSAPIVLTSGNLSAEPQAIHLEDACARLNGCVDYCLDHDRGIARRVDDSVGRVIGGQFRLMRRARGYAPAPLLLPPGFDGSTQVLALGGDLKNCFALLRDGQGMLSQHIGDLHDRACRADFERALADYLEYYRFTPDLVACDAHPGYATSQFAERCHPEHVVRIDHHHAHIAACLGEHGWPRNGAKILGIALDGIGMGADGSLWGGEFLLCDYVSCQRVASLRPAALLGGDAAAREPWRNTYAQLVSGLGWPALADFAHLPLYRFLRGKPCRTLDSMLDSGEFAPRASSAGRLFDAVAAAVDVCRDRAAYEGEAAIRLEQLITDEYLADDGDPGYPFGITCGTEDRELTYMDPAPMWRALLADLDAARTAGRIAARFHRGFATAIVNTAIQLRERLGIDVAALSGGVFQNRILAQWVMQGLAAAGMKTLLPRRLPANDGGLAWGQALIALARSSHCGAPTQENKICV